MKGLVIYSSKYGATAQYAKWLGEELNVPAKTTGEVAATDLRSADYLLIGTSVYYGKLLNRNWLLANERNIRDKKILLFVVNATAPGEGDKRDKFVSSSVSPALASGMQIYFLPGRVIHAQLSFMDRLALKLVRFSEKDPQKKKL